MRTAYLFFPLWLGYILVVDAWCWAGRAPRSGPGRGGTSSCSSWPRCRRGGCSSDQPPHRQLGIPGQRRLYRPRILPALHDFLLHRHAGGLRDGRTGRQFPLGAALCLRPAPAANAGPQPRLVPQRRGHADPDARLAEVLLSLCLDLARVDPGAAELLAGPPALPATSGTATGGWWSSLALGAVICGFFWEMWNYYSYPKWIYHTPGAQFLHVFEMPLLGYGGYVPFALELCALKNLLWPRSPELRFRTNGLMECWSIGARGSPSITPSLPTPSLRFFPRFPFPFAAPLC